MRIVARILVCVLIGSMLNFVVATICASANRPLMFERDVSQSYIRNLFDEYAPDDLEPSAGWEVYRLGTTVTNGRSSGSLRRSGWPFLSYAGFYYSPHYGAPGYEVGRVPVSTLEQLGLTRLGIWRVLTRPLWPGFIANTLIYAIAAYCILFLPFRLRCRARADRQQCPCCKYDLHDRRNTGEDVKCPECGAVFRALWFARPRQWWRPWWLPLTVPWIALGPFYFGQFTHAAPDILAEGEVLLFIGVLVLLIGLGLGIIASRAYPDRTKGARTAVGLTLGLIAAAPLVSFVSMFVLYHYGG